MNFYESKLFRFRRFQEALVGTLLTAVDQMKSDELLRFAQRQFTLFEQSAPMDLIAKLQSQSETIVPVGLLGNMQSTPTRVNASTNILIDWAGGRDASRFSVPLATLLPTMRLLDSGFAIREEIPAGMTLIVYIYLHALLLLHRIGRWFTTDSNPGHTHTEVVFCLVNPALTTLAISEVAGSSPLAWQGGHLVTH